MLCRRDALAGIREKIYLCDEWLKNSASGGNFFIVVTGEGKFIVDINSLLSRKCMNNILNYCICVIICKMSNTYVVAIYRLDRNLFYYKWGSCRDEMTFFLKAGFMRKTSLV